MENYFILSDSNFWIDNRLNRWNKDIFTEDEAKAISISIINCYECKNCIDCNNCFRCWDCYGCDNCNFCNNCTSCLDCESCVDCKSSNNCYTCSKCESCNNCSNNYMLSFITYKIKTNIARRILNLSAPLFNYIYRHIVKL